MRVETLPAATVCGNANHLRQLLNNLIDNAIKFTAAKHSPIDSSVERATPGVIKVQLRCDADNDRCLLEIIDDGVGIAEADQNRLFERFFRSDRARTRETLTSGTGLGLAICKAIVQAHNGSIQVASRLGEGTTVSVSLPVASPHSVKCSIP